MIPGEWWRRAWLLLRRDRAAADLEDEMRLHVELRARTLAAEGLAAGDAAATAHRRFGNVTGQQQASREAWGLRVVDELGQDVRYAARRLMQRPGFTCAVVGVLALGIGATTAMFSAVDAAMLRPLPFVRPGELLSLRNIVFPYDLAYAIGGHAPRPGIHSHYVTVADVLAMHDAFSNAGAYASGALNLGDPENPQHLRVGLVTPTLFTTLGVTPLMGRGFSTGEGAPAGPAVAILSYGLWQREYGGRDVLGHVIQLGGQSYAVVGVMRRDFSFPERSDIWIPLVLPTPADISVPLGGNRPSEVVARIAPGLTTGQAEQRLLLHWSQDLKPAGAAADKNVDDDLQDLRMHGAAEPLQQDLVGDRRRVLLILLGATAMVLLIAASNAASLVVAQVPVRRREIAVREVLGATRQRLVRQLLMESVMLSLAGGALGTALAAMLFGLIRALLPPAIEGLANARLDLPVLVCGFAVAMSVGIGVGIWPAMRATSGSPSEAIKSGGDAGTRRGASGVRRILVGAEVMLTVMLLLGAGLLLRSFAGLVAADRGVLTAHVGSMEIALPVLRAPRNIWDTLTSYSHLGDIWGLQRQRPKLAAIEGRLAETPGIIAAALVDEVPLSASDRMRPVVDIYADGTSAPPAGVRQLVRQETVSSDYFRALGIPVLAGRSFAASDDSGSAPVAIVSAAAARRYWHGANPIGRTVRLGPPSAAPITVVGIVGDVDQRGLGQDTFPQMYVPMAQRGMVPPLFAVVARGTLPPGELLAAMRHAVAAVDPSQAVYDLRMMDDVLQGAVAPQRTSTELIALFALLAFILAVGGAYAVVAHSVSQRAREFGIRAALGATASHVLRLVLGEVASVVLAGLAAGLALGWACSRVATAMIYGVSVHDPLTFIAVPVAVAVATTAAEIAPARRALRLNPAEVMRAE